MNWYREKYLKSEDWKNLRAAVLWKARNKCEACGNSSDKLDVHHRRYRKIYDVKTSDLRVLCRPCHTLIHKAFKIEPLLKILTKKHPSLLTAVLFKGGHEALVDEIEYTEGEYDRITQSHDWDRYCEWLMGRKFVLMKIFKHRRQIAENFPKLIPLFDLRLMPKNHGLTIF